jgi:hypothetical protein
MTVSSSSPGRSSEWHRSAAHAWAVNRLAAMLVLALHERAYLSVQIQNPLTLSEHDELQPDLMLLRAPVAAYRGSVCRSPRMCCSSSRWPTAA